MQGCFFSKFLSILCSPWELSSDFFLWIGQLNHLTVPLKSCLHHPSYIHPLIPAADGNKRRKGQNHGSEEVEIRDTDEMKGLIKCTLSSGATVWSLLCTWLFTGFQVYKRRTCSHSQSWGRTLAIPEPAKIANDSICYIHIHLRIN